MRLRNTIALLVACILVFGLLQLFPLSLSFQKGKDTKEAENIINQLSNRKVSEIDTQIQAIQERFQLKNIDTNSFSGRFTNTVILGDSLSAGLLEYNIMPTNLVLAQRGNRTDNIDGDIQTAIGCSPKAIFMEFGINDLGYCRGDANLFVTQYREQIIKLQKALPTTKIYINSLTPISKEAQSKNIMYTHVDEFNSQLKKMCEEMKLVYIDNTKLINFNGDVYEVDGVHPYYPYYPIWLSHMLTIAGL